MPSRPKGVLRRDLLRMASLLGVGLSIPRFAAFSRARAASGEVPLLLNFQAMGAYDVTMHADPKGRNAANQARPPNAYDTSAIVTRGGFPVAPQIPAVGDFFSSWGAKTLVINGIDTRTLDHGTGANLSMGVAANNQPVTGALAAAVLGGGMAAPFMSNGGTNDTDNTVAMTYLGGGLQNALATPMSGNGLHRADNWEVVHAAMQARNARLLAEAQAQARRARLSLFQEAFAAGAQLDQLLAKVTDFGDASHVPLDNPDWGAGALNAGGLAPAIQIACASMASGQTLVAHFAMGGFDTHGNNDQGQTQALTPLFAAIDYALRLLAYAGLQERVLVTVASDFSRAPFYNGPTTSSGKDHWPVTSELIISPGSRAWVPIAQTVGRTDDGLGAQKLDPKTLRPSDSGVSLQPGHLHDALRRLMGIADTSLVKNYPQSMAETLPLLG